jgi:phage-related tail protein
MMDGITKLVEAIKERFENNEAALRKFVTQLNQEIDMSNKNFDFLNKEIELLNKRIDELESEKADSIILGDNNGRKDDSG